MNKTTNHMPTQHTPRTDAVESATSFGCSNERAFYLRGKESRKLELELAEITKQRDELERRLNEVTDICNAFDSCFNSPAITASNADAMAFHSMKDQGCEDCGLTREALIAWLRSVSISCFALDQVRKRWQNATAKTTAKTTKVES